MRILDPGHRYALRHLDGNGEEILQFVKRQGEKYPGNVGSYEGTTMQEVLRALVQRAEYVQKQIPCEETSQVIGLLLEAIYQLEKRAARRHNREITFDRYDALRGETCGECGHVGCGGHCHSFPDSMVSA